MAGPCEPYVNGLASFCYRDLAVDLLLSDSEDEATKVIEFESSLIRSLV